MLSPDPKAPCRIARSLSERILVLDGGMGTMIQSYGLDEASFRGRRFAHHPQPLRGNCDVLNLTRPDIIAAIHESYVRAGADIIATNSFNCTRVAQAPYQLGKLAYDLNVAAAQIARAAADASSPQAPDKPRFVAGAMGPTSTRLSRQATQGTPAESQADFDHLREAFAEQASGLIDGGVDLLLVETIIDTLSLRAALCAISDVFNQKRKLPLMLSLVLNERTGEALCGQTLGQFCAAVAHAQPLAVMINCSAASSQLRKGVAELSHAAPQLFVGCYPNAGFPNCEGAYDLTPEALAGFVGQVAQEVNVVGGCCGTTPAHVRAVAQRVAGVPPRPRRA